MLVLTTGHMGSLGKVGEPGRWPISTALPHRKTLPEGRGQATLDADKEQVLAVGREVPMADHTHRGRGNSLVTIWSRGSTQNQPGGCSNQSQEEDSGAVG